MRTASLLACLASLVCVGCNPDAPPVGPTDAGPPDSPAPAVDAPMLPVDAGPGIEVAGGDVSGDWCGSVHVTATARVPAGSTLTVCAGSVVTLDADVSLTVEGTLILAGTDAAHVTLGSTAGGGLWGSIDVTGTLEGDFADVSAGTVCIGGRAASVIRLDDSTLVGCERSMQLANGGTFDRTEVTGGVTLLVTGGILRMTDSLVDLGRPVFGPDCTDWAGGGAILDHVHFTGCHCPIHINSSSLEVTVTGSLFDGATNTVMIANSVATFHGNNFIGAGAHLYDLDDRFRTGVTVADVAGNYWEGGPPEIQSTRPMQFTGTSDFLTTPIAGVGPR